MGGGKWIALATAVWLGVVVLSPGTPLLADAQSDLPLVHSMFAPASECMACHNSLTAPTGEDLSIGLSWRASIMANSSRDPYWQASVRRETIDHPTRKAAIEDECATCHMPMMRAQAHADGRQAQVLALLPLGGESKQARLAQDGVSCALCHQISAERLGTRDSFVGGFVINAPRATEPRAMFGAVKADEARQSVMRSVTGAVPAEAGHMRQSEVCATCHTLITEAFNDRGDVIGSIPEQVPYQEWRHSAFRDERSCQSCHMPRYQQQTRIASVLGEPRDGLSRHTFLGGNFFLLRMLNRFRGQLAVTASPRELDASASATLRQLQQDTAIVSIDRLAANAGRLELDVEVRNLTGHKLPTGYPSRRAWLHVTLADADGRVVFESGAVDAAGRIAGNDNDADPERYEPHYADITEPGQVQIYESVMQDQAGRPTTGLLRAVAFAKDNRLLPRGFDKMTADPEIGVHGAALADRDFTGGSDRVRYRLDVRNGRAPFSATVELRYQPISARWAENLRAYDAPEPRRFVGYYDALAAGSSTVLARATAHAE
jgi:hypothetical protein